MACRRYVATRARIYSACPPVRSMLIESRVEGVKEIAINSNICKETLIVARVQGATEMVHGITLLR